MALWRIIARFRALMTTKDVADASVIHPHAAAPNGSVSNTMCPNGK